MTVADTRPGLRGPRRAEPERADRSPRVGDGPPAVHAVASEAFNDAGGRAGADGALMHNPTLADPKRTRRAYHLKSPQGG